MDRWDIMSSNNGAVADYEYLLKWLLTDSTVGLIFKPKKAPNLFRRISRISDLIQEARATERCLFLTSETLVGSVFPAEAALIADVCIGKLGGSTAAFEARLAGKPTVLIDMEGFRDHPFYRFGKGQLVFQQWDELRLAVERYRAVPEAYPGFGSWDGFLDALDPFRDGQASRRIGCYLHWVREALDRGESKRDALTEATTRYLREWGAPSSPPSQLSETMMSVSP